MNHHYQADLAIIGGGIAGIVCAIEVMDNDARQGTNTRILMLDRDIEANLGGLAKDSFGGIWAVNTPEQKRSGIQDSQELALKDWLSFGEFGKDPEKEKWAEQWAREYVTNCTTDVYHWLKSRGIKFLPMPLWVERGLQGGGETNEQGGGNSVPRWHIVWGTGYVLANTLIHCMKNHAKFSNIKIVYEHQVTRLLKEDGKITGCQGQSNQNEFTVNASNTVIAAGGINGSMELVRKHWHPDWQPAPKTILNGSHKFADGTLHKATEEAGGNLTFLENMWNYAAGVQHWKPRKPNHGLSLVPSKSALWLNALGERITPPLVTSFDTRDLVTQICKQPEGYSWQLLNQKIAHKEFAISGSEFNHAFREQSYIRMIKQLLLGDRALVKEVADQCIDVVVADTLSELVDKMNALPAVNGETSQVDLAILEQVVASYDAEIDKGQPFQDEQLQRIQKAREWRGDKIRTCAFQKIADPKAGPFIAIREFIISRKSLGGIQTNLDAQALTPAGETIPGLYAIGESAGFGGGGMNGLRGLEGTFLGGCVYSGRRAGKSLTINNLINTK